MASRVRGYFAAFAYPLPLGTQTTPHPSRSGL
jgi:hypothetical protein